MQITYLRKMKNSMKILEGAYNLIILHVNFHQKDKLFKINIKDGFPRSSI